MAKLTRVTQRKFGLSGSVGNFGKFGSGNPGPGVYSQDPAIIQSLDAFINNGFADADVAGEVPNLEDMNGLFLVAFYQLAYLFEQGIPEWDASTTYYTPSSFVTYNGILYQSLQNSNLNKQPDTNPSWWGTPSFGVQTGVVQPYAGASAPSGYLLCQGQAISRTTYAALFSICGTVYGIGDGSTTFNIPDLRTRVPVGYKASDPDFGTLGNSGGEKEHTLITNEIPAHTHDIVGHNDVTNNGYPTLTGDSPSWTQQTQPTGGGAAHNNLQPYLTLNYIIKT